MIVDSLLQLHGNNIKIRIIKNIKTCSENDIQFLHNGLECSMIWHEQWNSYAENILMGVGKTDNKQIIYDFFMKNYSIDRKKYINLIHPKASLALSVKLGNGNYCNSGAVLDSFVSIGNFVTINRQAGVGHHTKISDFCVINPDVNIAGKCSIGKNTTIGMGANILDGLKVGENSFIGAGSLVTKDVPDNVVAFGSPAKIIKVKK